MVRRNLWFCPREVKTTAYTTLVRPIIEYASCAWDPYRQGSINKLERVQRKAARFCIGDYKRDSSVSQMLKDLEWDTLETRRERNPLAMLYKIQNSLVGINKESYVNVSSSAGVRKNHDQHLEVPFAKKDVYLFSFFPLTSKTWNNLVNKSSHHHHMKSSKISYRGPKSTNLRSTCSMHALQHS